MTHTLILLRHGQSQFNNQNLFAGWIDVSLTTIGINQAEKSADQLSKFSLYPDVLYTSKLKRTLQTGKIILDELDKNLLEKNNTKDITKPSHNCEIKRDWRLNERHYGKLQGRRKNDVLKEVGKEKYMFWRRAYDGVPPLISLEESKKLIDFSKYSNDFKSIEDVPRGESLRMVVNRLRSLLYNDIENDLIKKDKVVMVVAHGSTIRAILKMIKKISDEDIKELNIPNCVPLVLNVNDQFELIGKEVYLDPKEAKLRSEMVKMEGFTNHGNHKL